VAQTPPEEIGQEQSAHPTNPMDPIPPQHPRTIRHDRDLKGEASPGIVKGADLVGVERDGLVHLVPVVGAVGRHTAGRHGGEEDEERRGCGRGRRGRHRSRRAALTREAGEGLGWEEGRGRGRRDLSEA